MTGAVPVHHDVLGHQLLLAAEGQGLRDRGALPGGEREQRGLLLPGRGGGGLGGGGGDLDDAGQQGGGGEYGSDSQLSFHGQGVPSTRPAGACGCAAYRGVGVDAVGR
ncbi:hypothetical protein GCM10018790_24220 [Kitasatospora xanthocidica]|nr:hypothetical protein GCM10018790_24220 [Kitasatospora xanthocidica]